MTLVQMTDSLHQKSGFTGPRLQAITFAAALGMARYAGSEHQGYFQERFRETLDKLDAEGVSDVVGFIAAETGIQPEPVDVNRI